MTTQVHFPAFLATEEKENLRMCWEKIDFSVYEKPGFIFFSPSFVMYNANVRKMTFSPAVSKER